MKMVELTAELLVVLGLAEDLCYHKTTCSQQAPVQPGDGCSFRCSGPQGKRTCCSGLEMIAPRAHVPSDEAFGDTLDG
jgi:hypothetical protein